MRERKFDAYARIIQKAFRQYNARKQYLRLREEGECYTFNTFTRYTTTNTVVCLLCNVDFVTTLMVELSLSCFILHLTI